ncbi:MAG: hypothetical protein GY733_19060, partial [bacterium]|nr:hypothetical protein [bacterium]
MSEETEASSGNTMKLVVGVVGIGALLLGARQLGGTLPQLATWVEGLGALGPLVF